MLGVALVTWFAPSLSSASANTLFRLRGELKRPEDIMVVAIDNHSLQQLGRWPWPRSVMAKALDKISNDRPQAVGLDIIYAEPSSEIDDVRLAEAVRTNQRVVLPAELTASDGEASQNGSIRWLRPVIGDVAAVGHAHVSPDVDGILRSIQLSKADDNGTRLWAFSLEVLRVAEGIAAQDVEERPGILHFGPYDIVLRENEPDKSGIPGVQLNRSNEMLINYTGPAASFHRYSFVDVIDGKIPPGTFTDKIVLIGAVATSMSDVGVSPFINYGSNERHAGQEIPGVEVHANIINTIRQRVWLKTLPESYAFLIALGIIGLTALVISRLDGWRQIVSLGVIFLAILLGSFLAFKRFLVIPPVPAMLFGFAAAIPLLLNRSLSTSRRLDVKLAALARTQQGFLLDEKDNCSSSAESSVWLDLPHDLAWKLRAVDDITTRLVARMNFMDRVLSGMGEGVLVANTSGRLVFANREAAQVFNTPPKKLLFASFADACVGRGIFNESELRKALEETYAGRIFQKQFTIQMADARAHYALQLSAITTRENSDNSSTHQHPIDNAPTGSSAKVIGLVALITDTTRRVELDQIRIETLQLVSHELRTPLTSIQGLSDVLLKFPVETMQAREMLSTIHAEAARLSETINRYLDIARLESGAQPLKVTSIDVEQLVACCVRLHAPLAAERGIRIIRKLDSAVMTVAADEQLLAQAINNLLSNAIKYGPPDSEVSIQTCTDGTNLLIQVCDQGPGIPLEEYPRLFEKFYRLERDASSGVVGTGLGLPLVREIVEKHGGSVHVESTPGGGSTFTVLLPLEQPLCARGRN